MTTHTLLPYGKPKLDVTTTCQVERQGQVLRLNFLLSGQLNRLAWPAATALPERQDNLWQTTCFEAFVGSPASARYLELNLAPSGHWNVYEFDSPRRGMRVSESAKLSNLQTRLDNNGAEVGCELAINQTEFAGDWRVNLSCVLAIIGDAAPQLQYHAACLSDGKPDFHDPLCRQIELNCT